MKFSVHKDQMPEEIRVVEIVGPAGAGKTTLCQALDRLDNSIRLQNFPDVHELADAPFFILNGFELIPRLLRLYRYKSRQLTKREFAWLAILNGWSTRLYDHSKKGGRVIILDQGPVYLLAEMRLFGPPYLLGLGAEAFWQDLLKRWQAAIQMVVWLDADNDILLKRIRTRHQEHIVKIEPAEVVYDFLDKYRTEYECILSRMRANSANLRVLTFDSGHQQTSEIMDQLLSELTCYKA